MSVKTCQRIYKKFIKIYERIFWESAPFYAKNNSGGLCYEV